ncbi:aldehyde dehydrogenase family protein [Bradyrhizobium sp. Arg314]
MEHLEQFFINGRWVDPVKPNYLDVINPATESTCARIAAGSAQDVDAAVKAAREAFATYSTTSIEERVRLLRKICEVFRRRQDDFAQAITSEIGAPITLSREAQTAGCFGHFEVNIKTLEEYQFAHQLGSALVVKEPIGVVGLITPWNWPLYQVVLKVLPALATGCTVVLKPSEISPLDAIIFAEVLDEAGAPAGVFNLVNGEGAIVGEAISSHSDIDMVSFTGSTRAGIKVAKAAAETVKRVAQELGGKSANIVLDDADLEKSVRECVANCFANSGQSCDAPTRLLVPKAMHADAVAIARQAVSSFRIGDPNSSQTNMGPVANRNQFNKIQKLIQAGIDEGAELVVGGTGRPPHLDIGFFVKPTILASVENSMKVAQEEIFGPVLCILPYNDEEDAIRIANDTPYGLAGYVQSRNGERARKVARRLRVGSVLLNNAGFDPEVPFGGYKQSGNGREGGRLAFSEFLETKAILGYHQGG